MPMDLLNILDHMHGATVCVNGHSYQIDPHGVARGVDDVDARKLLLNSAGVWKMIPRRTAVQVAQPTTREPALAKQHRSTAPAPEPEPEPVVQVSAESIKTFTRKGRKPAITR